MEKIYELEWKEKFLDGVKHMEEIISGEQYSDLHVLDMYYCEIGKDGALYLKEVLMSKPMKSLQELDISGNAITDEGFEGIAEAILAGALPELVYLNVDDNHLSSKSMESLKKIIEQKSCPKLQAISLNLNEIGSEGCKLFAECIKQAPLPWCRINLNENHIKDEGFNALIEAITPISDKISEITLSQNELSTASLNRIGAMIKEDKLKNLAILDLSYNYSEDMLAGFFEGFDDCHTPILRRLVLSGMCMEAGGCNSLRTVIKNKYLPALQELLIAENNIMEKGVLAVLLAIREESCPIRLLDLSWNGLGDEGAKYIINFLNGKSNVQLAVLLLNQNDIAFKITDLQKALNKRGIHSPKLREQWL